MTGQTSAADWAEALSLGVSAIAVIALVLAFADADASYFDPRRLLDTDAGARLLVELVNVRYFLTGLALAAAIRLAVPNGATHV